MNNLITKCITLTVCLSIFMLVSCSMYQTHEVAEVIKGGANPLEAECAIKNDSLTFCVGLIARK